MIIGQKGVKYGLTVKGPKTSAASKTLKPSVFEAGDSDDEHDNVEQQIARQQVRKQDDQKVAALHAAALAEDAAVFDYDGHYDAIQEAREEPKRREKKERQSRYIAGLLEKAEERKREQDVLYERQMLKERAAEDHLFGDKERFVTAAYKKKLEEDQRYVANQKRIQADEEANAVEKKGHMGNFYRNLFKSNVAYNGSSRAGEAAQSAASSSHALVASRDGGAAERPVPASRGNEVEPAFEPMPSASGERPGALHHVSGSERKIEAEKRQEGPSQDSADETAGSEDEAGKAVGSTAAPAKPSLRDRQKSVAAARERYLARKRKTAEG
ncbi:hypothetical protein ACKKBG_A26550 [Auxenochlorella protothecoides x Auxenochlorella symbiontica]